MTTIYLRQSEDKTGERAAVERQLAECRDFCDAKGWTVSAVLQDNDISATSGAVRPAFEVLLSSRPDRIVVWHIDRLVRVTRDLERVIELGVAVHAVKSGHIDLSTPAGRAVARTVTAWAAYEGEAKSDRQRSANRQRAQRGTVLWSRRPFGFDRDGHDIRIVKSEAAEIRKAAKAVLAGATLASVARDLNRRGVTTSTGGKWTVIGVKRVLLSPRTAGRVFYKGDDMGATGHKAILDAATADRLAAKLLDPRRRTAPSVTTKHLLSGIVRCGRCGGRMFATPDMQGAMRYICRGCRAGRMLKPVDQVVLGVLRERLSRPDALALFLPEVDLDAMRKRATELRDRRDGLAAMLAEGLLSRDAVREQAGRLTAELGDVERQIEGASLSGPVARVLTSGDVDKALASLPLLDLREVIKTLMTVHIEPVGKGYRFRPEHVRIEWR